MDFEFELNSRINQLPAHVCHNPTVIAFKNNIIAAHSMLLLWTGPFSMDVRINWPQLISMIAGTIDISPTIYATILQTSAFLSKMMKIMTKIMKIMTKIMRMTVTVTVTVTATVTVTVTVTVAVMVT